MFFAGLATCASVLYHVPVWAALVFGAATGLSRNFLSMHWPTDTLAGLGIGAVLGWTWGLADPYSHRSSRDAREKRAVDGERNVHNC